jgi:NAD(P)-dependent dehydrogenase (short-subunit alcohol dehydrogenase family)
MSPLKPLHEQTIVITGASSGIGRVTAKEAVRRGARVVLAARNGWALRRLVEKLGEDRAVAIEADVSRESDVAAIALAADRKFGGFDTWVNNAGVSVYGSIVNVDLEDLRQVFETNFWGTVHGSRVAIERLQRSGGVLINVGSVLSDRAIPLQGIYCASKHAVKGFTDALRMELEKQKIPVYVSLIKPSAIDTPYTSHARNYLDVEPSNPPPVYAPELVADAILSCATVPRRDVTVGGGGRALSLLSNLAPRLMDWAMEKTMFQSQRSDRRVHDREGSLYHPTQHYTDRGEYTGHVFESSLYNALAKRPWLGLALLGGATALVAGAIISRGPEKEPTPPAMKSETRRRYHPTSLTSIN